MTRQAIATGSTANDGSGDTLRRAGQKINENFVELYKKLGGDSDFLSLQISLEDSAIAFEGGSINTFQTRLIAKEPTQSNIISLPDLSGELVASTGIQNISDKTLLSATINSPKIGEALFDSNGNTILNLNPDNNTPVNEITISNSGSGNDVRIEASGTDTNIGFQVSGKGTGAVDIQKYSVGTSTQQSSGGADATVGHVICDKSTQLNVTLGDGTYAGEVKIFTNKGLGNAVITPTNFTAPGGSVTIPQYGSASFIWNGDTWYVIATYGI